MRCSVGFGVRSGRDCITMPWADEQHPSSEIGISRDDSFTTWALLIVYAVVVGLSFYLFFFAG